MGLIRDFDPMLCPIHVSFDLGLIHVFRNDADFCDEGEGAISFHFCLSIGGGAGWRGIPVLSSLLFG